MRRHALAEVVVAEREAEPARSRGAERLAGHDRHLGLVEQDAARSSVVSDLAAADRPAEQAVEVGEAVERAPAGSRQSRPRCR